ncbi:LysR substrate-binding domain-containing protein [Marinomonas mediterranea]|uniref:LysR substrate-binding domain-containing protein n=1 Tax=Marinomonas mediterranea TaxID=119864 RepID=UPI0023490A80|nr:LysR substrate-binding domain-containing protein [Marinomonas mediterranea]WCN08828.1 LysR family transcriptional regulator [Marinomonas mediterranea]
MDINDLSVFVAVIEQNGITPAAKHLHRVPSNITARIQKLEEELGQSLFFREKNRLKPNNAGLKLLGHAKQILKLQHHALQDLTDQEPSGLLRLGSMENNAASRLPYILSHFHKQYDRVEMELKTGASGQLVEMVLSGALDIAFVSDPPSDTRLEKAFCFDEELVMILPLEYAHLPLPEKLTMVGYNRGCSYRARLENWFKHNSHICDRVIEIPSHYTMISCVIAGMGVGIVPKSVLALHHFKGEFIERKIESELAIATTYLVWRKDNVGGAINAFLHSIKSNQASHMHKVS